MKDQNKTKAQLISELEEMRQRVSELERAEESNDSLLTIFDSIDADVYVSDMETYEILFMNQHMRESFGKELVGEICWQVFRGESGPCPHCTNDQLLDADGNPTGVVTWEGQNPFTKRWYINHDRAIKWVDDRIVRLQVAIDITEIKQAEKGLRDSEARFRSLIEQSPFSTVLYTPEGQPIYGNPATSKLWNMPPELVQQVYQTYNILEDKQLAEQGILPDIQKGFAGEFAESYPIRYDPRQTDSDYVGPVRWLRAFIYPVKDGDEEIREVVVMHADITDQVNAEVALRTEKEFTDMALDAQLDTFFLFEPATNRAIRWNQSFKEISGYSDEEISRMPAPASYYSPTDLKKAESFIQKILNDGSGTIELELICKDGRKVPTEYRVSTINDDQGELKYMISLGRDISERKRVFEALQEREKRLNTIYENVKEVIFTLNVEERGKKFRFQSINPAFLEATGLKASQVVGKLVSEVIPEPSLSLVLSNYQRACKNKKTVRWEEVTPYPSGNKVGDVNVTPIFNDYGNCTHLIGTVYDITERVKVEEKIRRQTEELSGLHLLSEKISSALSIEQLAPAALDGIRKVLQPDLVYFFLREGEKLNLIASAPENARPDFETHEHRVGECMCGLAVSTGKTLYSRDISQDVRCTWDECKKAGFRSFAALPLWADSEIVGVLGITSMEERDFESEADYIETVASQVAISLQNVLLYERLEERTHQLELEINEREHVEIQRENLIQKLEIQNAELERFAYTVSHDLKSPLITINGFIGHLEEDAISGNIDRLRGDIQRVQAAVKKMKRLLDELLELSRIGRLMNPPLEVPFEEIASEALDNVYGQLEARGIAVILEPNLPTVYGDRQRLVEVLQNLIDNAAKYVGEQTDPKIEIGQCSEEDGKPIFFVRDNGIGIMPEYHERIFGLFEKLDAKTEGTGIGLALVKRIVEFHGGRIWVESEAEAGKGSTFYFTLPRSDE